MEIKLGDTIRDDRGREGVLTNIGIATSKSDVAGELGVDAKEDHEKEHENKMKTKFI